MTARAGFAVARRSRVAGESSPDRPVVALQQAERTYPGEPPVQALLPCDLVVERGEYVAITGPSGSGKSTLLNILGLLDAPTSGRFLLDGEDVTHLREGRRTALRAVRIGFVFQLFHLLPHASALENVELGMLYGPVGHRARRERALMGLERVGLGHRVASLPTHLSGGERQRVAIARALAGTPTLLLCDEPTGALDTVTSREILDLLEELHAEGLTIVAVTHDDEVAARADRLLVIRDGVLLAG